MELFSGNERRVIVPRHEIAAFNRQWPCSTLRDRAYWFEFDASGDLVDTDCPASDDGPAAMAIGDYDMSDPKIYLAYSRNKHGFTCYSYELWPSLSDQLPTMKSGFNIAGADTLEEAKDIIMNRIRANWAQTERPFPEIIDCGKISEIRGFNHSF